MQTQQMFHKFLSIRRPTMAVTNENRISAAIEGPKRLLIVPDDVLVHHLIKEKIVQNQNLTINDIDRPMNRREGNAAEALCLHQRERVLNQEAGVFLQKSENMLPRNLNINHGQNHDQQPHLVNVSQSYTLLMQND